MRLGIEIKKGERFYQLFMMYADGNTFYICDCLELIESGMIDKNSLLKQKVGFDYGAANGLINPKGAINKLKLMLHGINEIRITNDEGNYIPLD